MRGHALNDVTRLQALRRSNLMDSAPEPAYDRITTFARTLTGRPTAYLSLVDSERQYFKALSGMSGPAAEARQTPLASSICQYVVRTGEPLVVDDVRVHPDLQDNLAISDLNVVAYLGIPVRSPEGDLLGSLCVTDSVPHAWRAADVENMTALAGMVEDQIALQQALDDRDLLLREMLHRAGNRMATISAVVRMAGRDATTPQEAVGDIQTRLQAMTVADRMIQPITQARQGTAAPSVTLSDVIEPLLSPYRRGPDDKLWLTGPAVEIGGRAVTSFALIFQELIVNSSKYGALGATNGSLWIRWQSDADTLRIDWIETGKAEALHVPASTGFGSRLLELCVEHQLGGSIETDIGDGRANHLLTLPIQMVTR